MRITSKGQVTIPAHIREKAGLLPDTEVDFEYDGKGKVLLFRAKKPKGKTRGERIVEQMRQFGRDHPPRMTTDELMAHRGSGATQRCHEPFRDTPDRTQGNR